MSRGNRSRPAGERTAEERDRAREERARRRAARAEGNQPNGLVEASPGDTPAPAEPQAAAQADDAVTNLEPTHTGFEDPTSQIPPAPAPAAKAPSPAPAAQAPQPSPAAQATPAAQTPLSPLAARVTPAGQAPLSPPAVHATPAALAPLPPRVPEAPLPPPAAPVAPSGPRGPGALRVRPRSHHSRRGRVAAFAAIVAALVVIFVVLRSLLGTSHTKTVAPTAPRVVIPEGSTRLQIAQIAAADGLTGSYRAAAKSSPLLNAVHYGAPRDTPDLEGFLFPATYELAPRASVSRLVDEQLAAFKENFGTAETRRARALRVTPYQLLTIASMIEREARVPGDRAKIAAVIYNRLHRGMPLGIDATIYYAIETREGIATYTKELSEAQLHIDSAYNTRTHTGLPPTPISNPGLASIQAAAHPDHVPYLYYVLAADGCGEHVFSRTLAEFEVNASAYDAAVKKNGGRPPSCKRK